MPALEISVKGIRRPGLWVIDGELLAGRCIDRTRFVAGGIAAAIVFVLETHRDEDGGERGECVGMREMRKKGERKGGRWRATPILELQEHPTQHMLRRSTLQFQTAAANHVPPYWGHCFGKSRCWHNTAFPNGVLRTAAIDSQCVQLAIAWRQVAYSNLTPLQGTPSARRNMGRRIRRIRPRKVFIETGDVSFRS